MHHLLRAEPSSLLTPEAFQKRFDEASTALQSASRKVEALPFYDETGDPSWEKLQQGDWDGAVALLNSVMEEEAPEIGSLIERGIEVTRLRIVQRPITAYLRWEFESYKLSSELGEKIRVLEHNELSDEEILPDLVAFDANTLIILDYSPEGRFVAAHEFGRSRTVDEVLAIYDRLMHRAVPFEKFVLSPPA